VPPLPASLPGVPPFLGTVPLPALLTADGFIGTGLSTGTQWGIFSATGSPILTVDSVASVEYARDYRISDYPQEQGAFFSYNKVQTPFQGKVGFLLNQSRFSFLNQIEAQLASLNFVTLVTPEITYPSANLTHYDFRRTSRNGVTMVLVTVWVEEVRVVTATTLANAQGNNAQPTLSGGSPQAQQTSTDPTNLQSGQGNPASSSVTGSQELSATSAFYTPSNVPVVPNSAATLTPPQLGTTQTFGLDLGASSGTVTAPDVNGNVQAEFFGTGF
jgi:hypothetical protein